MRYDQIYLDWKRWDALTFTGHQRSSHLLFERWLFVLRPHD